MLSRFSERISSVFLILSMIFCLGASSRKNTCRTMLELRRGLSTDRLFLKPVSEEHFETLSRLAPSVAPCLPRMGIHKAKLITKKLADNFYWEDWQELMFLIVEKRSAEVVGLIGIQDLGEGPWQGVNLYYGILPQFRKLGYATESGQKLVSVAFQSLGIKALVAFVERADNRDSKNVLRRLQFQWIGNRPDGVPFYGRHRNDCVLANSSNDDS